VDRVIDVGTAIGVVAMTAASIVGAENVLTFDANPNIVSDARDNFRRNGLEGIRSHVGILRNRQAITDPHETVKFYISKEFWSSRLSGSTTDTDIVGSVEVPILCLADLRHGRWRGGTAEPCRPFRHSRDHYGDALLGNGRSGDRRDGAPADHSRILATFGPEPNEIPGVAPTPAVIDLAARKKLKLDCPEESATCSKCLLDKNRAWLPLHVARDGHYEGTWGSIARFRPLDRGYRRRGLLHADRKAWALLHVHEQQLGVVPRDFMAPRKSVGPNSL
jgi:FkbM family methyltransferase